MSDKSYRRRITLTIHESFLHIPFIFILLNNEALIVMNTPHLHIYLYYNMNVGYYCRIYIQSILLNFQYHRDLLLHE